MLPPTIPSAPLFSGLLRASLAGQGRAHVKRAGVFPEEAVKGRAFGSPLARVLYLRASTAEMDPRANPGPRPLWEGRAGTDSNEELSQEGLSLVTRAKPGPEAALLAGAGRVPTAGIPRAKKGG